MTAWVVRYALGGEDMVPYLTDRLRQTPRGLSSPVWNLTYNQAVSGGGGGDSVGSSWCDQACTAAVWAGGFVLLVVASCLWNSWPQLEERWGRGPEFRALQEVHIDPGGASKRVVDGEGQMEEAASLVAG